MKRLNGLINEYGVKKEELDLLKKETDNINKTIKSLMKADNLTEVITTMYKVNYQVRTSESLDEEKVIDILKANGIKGIIKTKEYVDEEALENAIYTGKLEPSILKEINKCKISKETVALTIKGV